MKSVLLFIAASTISLTANAIIVENVKQVQFIDPACEMCLGGRLVTKTIIHFSDVSCGNLEGQYEIKLEEKVRGLNSDTEKFVTVQHKINAVDCYGPTKKRDYNLSTEELSYGERYIIGNPSVIRPILD